MRLLGATAGGTAFAPYISMEAVSTLHTQSNHVPIAQASTLSAQSSTFDAAFELLLAQGHKKSVQTEKTEVLPGAGLTQPKSASRRRAGALGIAEATPDIAAISAAQLAARPSQGAVAQADAACGEQSSSDSLSTSAQQSAREKSPTLSSSTAATRASASDQVESTSSIAPTNATHSASHTQAVTSAASSHESTSNQAAHSGVSPLATTSARGSVTSTAASPLPRAAAIPGTKSGGATSSNAQSHTSNHAAQPHITKRAVAFRSLLAQGQPVRHAVHQHEVQATALRAMQLTLSGNGGDVTLRMNPGELGTLHAKLMIQDTRVNADFVATTEVARDLLVHSVDSLRSALETRGLTVDSISISGPEGQKTDHAGQDAQHTNSERGGAADPNASHSRSDGEQSRARTPNRHHAEAQSLWSLAPEVVSSANGLEWIV